MIKKIEKIMYQVNQLDYTAGANGIATRRIQVYLGQKKISINDYSQNSRIATNKNNG